MKQEVKLRTFKNAEVYPFTEPSLFLDRVSFAAELPSK
jgi:hypothetical protein